MAAATPSFTPLKVEGAIRHPGTAQEAWEYSVVVSIKNDRGEVVRHVLGVGAIDPGEARTFTFSVDVFTPADAPPPHLRTPR